MCTCLSQAEVKKSASKNVNNTNSQNVKVTTELSVISNTGLNGQNLFTAKKSVPTFSPIKTGFCSDTGTFY